VQGKYALQINCVTQKLPDASSRLGKLARVLNPEAGAGRKSRGPEAGKAQFAGRLRINAPIKAAPVLSYAILLLEGVSL
jgi:hypothetical protein